jgi:hypothetical protein
VVSLDLFKRNFNYYYFSHYFITYFILARKKKRKEKRKKEKIGIKKKNKLSYTPWPPILKMRLNNKAFKLLSSSLWW